MNVDPQELEKFDELAHRWWDPGADFKPLHDINPLRLEYIDKLTSLKGKTVLDIGCGGGILSESMAVRGAHVTGIDLGEKALKVAELHRQESKVEVEYLKIATEELAREQPHHYDVVTCMEFLEHVPDPASTVQACAELVKPGGQLYFATINRNLKSYIFAVIGAEYVLRLLPRGTHDYARFIKPSELARFCRDAGLNVQHITGMTYNPFSKIYALGPDTDVNYILHAKAG